MSKQKKISCPWCGKIINSNSLFCPCCRCKIDKIKASHDNYILNNGKNEKESKSTLKKRAVGWMVQRMNNKRDLGRLLFYLIMISLLIVLVVGMIIFLIYHPFLALFVMLIIGGVIGCIFGDSDNSSGGGGGTYSGGSSGWGGSSGFSEKSFLDDK